MKYILTKHPRRPVIIEGFPGYGLVGSIVTNYLVETLNMEPIGNFYTEKIPSILPIHKSKIVNPLGIYYSKDLNLIVSNIIVYSKEIEWPYAHSLINLAQDLDARKILSIEGISVPNPESKVYAYSNNKEEVENLKKKNFQIIEEAMIVGPTAAILLLSNNIPIVCFFAETHLGVPDSRAAAEAIKAIDKYLGLKIDYKPLLKEAEEFENSLKQLMEKASKTNEEKEKKRVDYFG